MRLDDLVEVEDPADLNMERPGKTADFYCSRSGNLRTVFGTRLRLLFAIGSGLRCRDEKRDPVPDLLTSSAFVDTVQPTNR